MRTFSLILPVYRVAADLPECLDSIAVQRESWEAICIDDGSPDTCGESIDHAVRRDARFRAIHQRNAGVSAARNRGLEAARGAWLWFIDADDAIHPQALARLAGIIRTAKRRPQAISFEIVYAEQAPVWKTLPEAGGYYETAVCTEAIFWRFRAGVCRTLLARELIADSRFEPFGMGEDMLFSLSYFAKMSYWTLLDEVLYFYRARPGSACHSPVQVKVVRDWLGVQARLMDVLLDSCSLREVGGGYRGCLFAVVGCPAVLYFRRDVLQAQHTRNGAMLCTMGGAAGALLGILSLSALQAPYHRTSAADTVTSLGACVDLLAIAHSARALPCLRFSKCFASEEAA